MFYATHLGDDTDTPGRIIHGAKVYSLFDTYEKSMNDLGQKYVKRNSPELLSPDQWMISTRQGSIVPIHKRSVMRVSIDKTTIKAGDNDKAVLLGAPKNVAFTISVMGSEVWSGTLPDGELELSVPTPGLYRVVLDKWPYQQFKVDIEAVA